MLMDISMPGGGLSAIAPILERHPAQKIVMLTVSESSEDITASLQNGAKGFVLKGVGSRALAEVLRTVAAGESYVSPTLSARLLSDPVRASPKRDPIEDLTAREREFLSAGVAAEVRAFLRYRPALLFQFDPAVQQRAFPTPRAWQFVSDVLAKTPADLLHAVVAGCVGDGPAAEFVGFLRLYRDLPDLDQVLARPDTSPVPREPAVLYALVGALVERWHT